MKKLLLTSTGLTHPAIAKRFLSLLDKPPAETKILFVPTASRTEGEMKYVRKSAAELTALGINEKNIVWFDANNPKQAAPFEQYDVVYVCGGNTFYLMQKLLETGLGEEIKKLVGAGKLYVGVSAGSIVAGPDISIAAPFDPNDIQLNDPLGLGLTKIVISPHFCKEEEKIIDDYKKKLSFKIIPLTDQQAYEEINGTERIFE
jgi:peptidase E